MLFILLLLRLYFFILAWVEAIITTLSFRWLNLIVLSARCPRQTSYNYGTIIDSIGKPRSPFSLDAAASHEKNAMLS